MLTTAVSLDTIPYSDDYRNLSSDIYLIQSIQKSFVFFLFNFRDTLGLSEETFQIEHKTIKDILLSSTILFEKLNRIIIKILIDRYSGLLIRCCYYVDELSLQFLFINNLNFLIQESIYQKHPNLIQWLSYYLPDHFNHDNLKQAIKTNDLRIVKCVWSIIKQHPPLWSEQSHFNDSIYNVVIECKNPEILRWLQETDNDHNSQLTYILNYNTRFLMNQIADHNLYENGKTLKELLQSGKVSHLYDTSMLVLFLQYPKLKISDSLIDKLFKVIQNTNCFRLVKISLPLFILKNKEHQYFLSFIQNVITLINDLLSNVVYKNIQNMIINYL